MTAERRRFRLGLLLPGRPADGPPAL